MAKGNSGKDGGKAYVTSILQANNRPTGKTISLKSGKPAGVPTPTQGTK